MFSRFPFASPSVDDFVALKVPSFTKVPQELSHRTPLMVPALAHACARSGSQAEAQNLLVQLNEKSSNEHVFLYYIAIVYTGLGENDKAIDELYKAFTDRFNGLMFMQVEPELDGLRSNPRFIVLDKKFGFSAPAPD